MKIVKRQRNGEITGQLERSPEWVEQNREWLTLKGFTVEEEDGEAPAAGVYVPLEVFVPEVVAEIQVLEENEAIGEAVVNTEETVVEKKGKNRKLNKEEE